MSCPGGAQPKPEGTVLIANRESLKFLSLESQAMLLDLHWGMEKARNYERTSNIYHFHLVSQHWGGECFSQVQQI